MLKQLRMTNLILIESAEIDFSRGFNVLSGETGSGKSAIMHAISLIAGERADSSILRKGAEKGTVEAIFDSKILVLVENLLHEAGIDFEVGDDLYVRREISSVGKSRAWINNQLAQLSVLRAISTKLVNIVGQHANQDLFLIERHREILDIFGGLKEEVLFFSKCWEEEISLQRELDLLTKSEAQRLRDCEVCEMILEELQEAALKEGEDDELFNEYTLLSNAEELGLKIQTISSSLSGEKYAVLTTLQRQKNLFDELAEMDPKLLELSHSFHNAILELQEIANSLNFYGARIEINPQRLNVVNERLSLILKLKKKYGSSLQEINAFADITKTRLKELQNTDQKIEDLQERLKIVKMKNNQLAIELTQQRKKAAVYLASELKRELSSLNMPHVDFYIDVTSQKRNVCGDDCVEFFLQPNVGEHRIPIKNCASGGELSRVMLSIQTLLSGRESIPTIIFDEIDANIGGETAKIVGEKLLGIGKKQQVLCVTHFPQVARYADHHLQISKCVVDSRTITQIHTLDKNNREQEMARMAGVSTD